MQGSELTDAALARTAGLDPITLSVILNRLNGIVTEMSVALEHAAMSSILAMCRDYSCCIYDSQARQLAMVDGCPIHTSSMHLLLNRVSDTFDAEFHQGDVIMCNYAHAANTHIGDFVTLCPVFSEGRHLFWAVAKGHQIDVGGARPTSADAWARDVWAEGLQLPPIKIYDRGRPRRDVIEMYLTNVRYRWLLEGDLMAQLGSIWTAERRLHDLCEEFGVNTLEEYLEETINYAARRTRAAIRKMPNGTYTGEAWLDSDGLDTFNIPVRATVTIHEESVHVDFSGSASQNETAVNASYAIMQAAGTIPVVMLTDPDIPHNEGCLRCVTVTAPEGTITNAKHPAATACGTTQPGDVMQEAVTKALAQAMPERTPAGGARWGNVPMITGVSPETGQPWGHVLMNAGAGGAAAPRADGWPLITTMACAGGLRIPSVEETELLYPIHFEHLEVEPDSAGLGEHIGGPGVRCRIRARDADLTVFDINDGLDNPPFGHGGATAAAGGGHFIERTDGERRVLPPTSLEVLRPGDTWTAVGTGGGGWGNPLNRPIERVREDVRDGYISRGRAREVYGLVVDASLDPVVDTSATEAARAVIRGRQRNSDGSNTIVPSTPRASDWLKANLRPTDVRVAPMTRKDLR